MARSRGARARGAAPLAGLLLGATSLTACPDPVGQFEEFTEKLAARPVAPTGECGADVTQSVNGTFFVAFATQLARTLPVVMLAEIHTDDAGMHMVLQPLAVADRQTPAGEPIVAAPVLIAPDGSFDLTLHDVTLPPESNPLSTDAIVAPSLQLEGTACAAFLCGDLSGRIEEPIPLTLEAGASQFAMQRVAPGEPYPEPPAIDCGRELASPLE